MCFQPAVLVTAPYITTPQVYFDKHKRAPHQTERRSSEASCSNLRELQLDFVSVVTNYPDSSLSDVEKLPGQDEPRSGTNWLPEAAALQ